MDVKQTCRIAEGSDVRLYEQYSTFMQIHASSIKQFYLYKICLQVVHITTKKMNVSFRKLTTNEEHSH